MAVWLAGGPVGVAGVAGVAGEWLACPLDAGAGVAPGDVTVVSGVGRAADPPGDTAGTDVERGDGAPDAPPDEGPVEAVGLALDTTALDPHPATASPTNSSATDRRARVARTRVTRGE